MLYGLDIKLEGIIPPSQIEMFQDAIDALELFKNYAVAGPLTLFVESAADYEQIVVQDGVRGIFEDQLDLILSNFEIELDTDRIDVKTKIIRGLYYMENTDQAEFVVNLINNSSSVKDAFIELLCHFTGYEAEFYFPFVCSGNNAYISKLYELHKVNADLLVEDIMPCDESVVNRCKKFMAKYNHTLLHKAIFEDQLKPGVSDELLFRKYNLELCALYPNSLDQLAVEIVGLMCLSNAMSKNFGMEVKNKLSQIVVEKAKAASMVTIVDDITMRLGLYAEK